MPLPPPPPLVSPKWLGLTLAVLSASSPKRPFPRPPILPSSQADEPINHPSKQNVPGMTVEKGQHVAPQTSVMVLAPIARSVPLTSLSLIALAEPRVTSVPFDLSILLGLLVGIPTPHP